VVISIDLNTFWLWFVCRMAALFLLLVLGLALQLKREKRRKASAQAAFLASYAPPTREDGCFECAEDIRPGDPISAQVLDNFGNGV
jgi:hypothetical protein